MKYDTYPCKRLMYIVRIVLLEQNEEIESFRRFKFLRIRHH